MLQLPAASAAVGWAPLPAVFTASHSSVARFDVAPCLPFHHRIVRPLPTRPAVTASHHALKCCKCRRTSRRLARRLPKHPSASGSCQKTRW